MLKKYSYHIAVAIAYVSAFLFVTFGIGTECYHIMQHPAFLSDFEFFKSEAAAPGGIGVYLSLFVEQFFYIKPWGGLLLTIEMLLASCLLCLFVKRVSGNGVAAKSLLWMVPLFVSVLCFNNIYFAFHVITQLMLLLAVLYLLHIISMDNKLFWVAEVVAAVVVYHVCGPMYLYSFCITEVLLNFIYGNLRKVINAAAVLGVALFYPAILYRFVLALTPKLLFYNPVADVTVLEQYQLMMYLFFLIAPLSVVAQYFANKFQVKQSDKHNKKSKDKHDRTPYYYIAVLAVMLAIIVVAFSTDYDKRERFSARITYEAERANWQYVIEHCQDYPEYDRNTNYYYDMALSQTGKMGNQLFDYPQLLGSEALIIEEPLAGTVCYPASTLYFNIGQISNSLHYSFESIIYFKNSPYVMRRIIDCLIISNRYTEAEMFLKQLDRNMLAHAFVKDRRNFIAGKNDCKLSRDFVAVKQHLAVKWDYIMSPPFRNFEQLFLTEKNNQAATDYLLCYCLLENDLPNFLNVLTISNYNLANLPKHYQEALAVCYATNQPMPQNLRNVQLDKSIVQRFGDFATLANRKGEAAYPEVKQNFADTYWIYYTYENPMKKNFSLKNNHPL